MLYIQIILLFFGSGVDPLISNVGRGEGFRNFKGVCQFGTRSNMEMMVNLISFDNYRIVLLKEWLFGKIKDTVERVYKFKVDGKKVEIAGIPYVAGMYTYSPTFIAIFRKKLKWKYTSSDNCTEDFHLIYPGNGLYLLEIESKERIKKCNIMSLNTQTIEIAPLYQTRNSYVFLLRVEDSLQDSIMVLVAREGKFQKSEFIKPGELYLGIMDNVHYDLQVGDIDINLPEALRLLGQ